MPFLRGTGQKSILPFSVRFEDSDSVIMMGVTSDCLDSSTTLLVVMYAFGCWVTIVVGIKFVFKIGFVVNGCRNGFGRKCFGFKGIARGRLANIVMGAEGGRCALR